MADVHATAAADADPARLAALREALTRSAPQEAAEALLEEEDARAADALAAVSPALAVEVLWKLPEAKREAVLRAVPPERREQWTRNQAYPEHTVGRLMNRARAVFGPDDTVADAVARLRGIVREALITYGYVADAEGRLIGVLIFRELIFAAGHQPLHEVMLRNPYALRPDMDIEAAMKAAVVRHFPEYPVAEADGRLVGILRGETLFQQQAFELSAQAGRMVGVEAEERLGTPWRRSLRARHPWLQLNLLTAFAAAAVVATFQDTIDRVVLLAAFLPVLAGQSGNTGCQALAVTLRGMTLGEMSDEVGRRVARKEMLLGLLNGAFVGITAGLGMYAYAGWQESSQALRLAFVVFGAMTLACVVSGVAGTLIPRTLRRLGADPATASSIFLTTATDVVSMGVFLALATMFVR